MKNRGFLTNEVSQDERVYNIVFVEDSYGLVIMTNFKGPDDTFKTMNVAMPDEKTAREFVKFMGWEKAPFKVIKAN